MIITIVYSEKGGSGKSTLAAQLAAELASEGQKVALADSDPQGTLSNWSLYRQEQADAPQIAFLILKLGDDLDYAIKQLTPKYDHLIVDLAGGATDENVAALIYADKIVLPFKPTQPDLDNLPKLTEVLGKLKKHRPEIECYYVINEATHSSAKVPEADQARAYFATYDIQPLETVVYKRKAYRDSMALGKGAGELKDPKAKAEIKGLWSEIYRPMSDKRRQEVTKSTRQAPTRQQNKA